MLKSPNGYEYVNMDFFEMFPENYNGLIENFGNVSKMILQKSFEKSKGKILLFDPEKERSSSKKYKNYNIIIYIFIIFFR